MRDLRCFQIYEQKAFKDIIVEYKVYIIFAYIGFYSLLTGYKSIAFAKFKDEFLQVVDYSRFKICFRVRCFLRET